MKPSARRTCPENKTPFLEYRSASAPDGIYLITTIANHVENSVEILHARQTVLNEHHRIERVDEDEFA